MRAVEVEDLLFLRKHTSRKTKSRSRPLHHDAASAERLLQERGGSSARLRRAVNEEIRDLFAAGADVVQIDEPYMQAQPEKARAYGLKP